MKLLKFTEKLLVDRDFKKILLFFLIWKLSLFFILCLSYLFIPLAGKSFLGGGFDSYQSNPLIFSWANFDGEHYLNIIQNGYQHLNHSFFPLYPLFTSVMSLFSKAPMVIVSVGLIISNLAFVISLFLMFKLVLIDYPKKIAYLTIYLFFLFPTSFYFGAFYTESLFLLFSVATVYLFKKDRFLLATIFGILASATRIGGVILLPVLIIEWYQGRKRQFPYQILLILLGLLSYMVYLYFTTGDYLAFYHELSAFGEQRQGNFVLLPQVFFRYINILFNVNPLTHIYWSALIEMVSAITILLLLIYGYFRKVRLSYLIYGLIAFLLPTFTGSFSSLPRYFITIFPLFIILSIFISKRDQITKMLIFLLLGLLLIIETSLFLRGYWVS